MVLERPGEEPLQLSEAITRQTKLLGVLAGAEARLLRREIPVERPWGLGKRSFEPKTVPVYWYCHVMSCSKAVKLLILSPTSFCVCYCWVCATRNLPVLTPMNIYSGRGRLAFHQRHTVPSESSVFDWEHFLSEVLFLCFVFSFCFLLDVNFWG